MKCPRCSQYLEKLDVGKLTLDVCPQCEGSFFDFGELDRVFSMSEKQVQKSPLAKIWDGDASAELDLEKLITCPRCDGEMERGRYFSECPVIIDKCPEHGVWLDDGELGQLMDYLADSVGAGKGEDDTLKARLGRAPDAIVSALMGVFGLK